MLPTNNIPYLRYPESRTLTLSKDYAILDFGSIFNGNLPKIRIMFRIKKIDLGQMFMPKLNHFAKIPANNAGLPPKTLAAPESLSDLKCLKW